MQPAPSSSRDIRLLGPALDDLDHIEDWVLEHFGEAAAIRAIDTLLDTFELLAKFQEAGIARPDIAPLPMRFFASPPNWIVYEPGDPLLIHRVFSARTDSGRANS